MSLIKSAVKNYYHVKIVSSIINFTDAGHIILAITIVYLYSVKKILATILAFLYICASTGATLQMHYCMGKPAGWELGHDKPTACDICGMESVGQDNDCCRDELKFFKDNTDQQSPNAGLQLLLWLGTSLPPTHLAIQTNYFPSVAVDIPMSHAPPPLSNVAVYIRNCVFLI